MKGFYNIFLDEVSNLLKNKTLLLFIVVFPLGILLLFNGFIKHGVVRDLPIAVIDNDNSANSRQFIAYLESTPELEVTYNLLSPVEAENLLKTTKIYGFVVIPENFDRDLRTGKRPIILNQFNQNLLLPGGLENRGVSNVIRAFSSKIQIKSQLANGVPVYQAQANLQPVKLDAHVLSNPYLSYRYYLLTGLVPALLQVFIMLSTIYVIGGDLKYFNGKKLINMSNENLSSIIFGKLLPYTLWFYFTGLILYYCLFVFQDFPLKGSRPMLLLALLLLILTTQAFGFLFAATSKNIRSAMTKGNVIAAVSLTMSGFTFPHEAMLPFFRYVKEIFPFTHFFEIFKDLTLRGVPAFYVLSEISILIFMTVLFLFIGAIKYQKQLINGGYEIAN